MPMHLLEREKFPEPLLPLFRTCGGTARLDTETRQSLKLQGRQLTLLPSLRTRHLLSLLIQPKVEITMLLVVHGNVDRVVSPLIFMKVGEVFLPFLSMLLLFGPSILDHRRLMLGSSLVERNT